MPPLTRYAARPAGAITAGLCLWLSFPTHDLWWLAPIGVALLAGVTWARGFRAGFCLGMLSGWAYFVPTLSWSGTYVGKVPWFALATLQALYVAVMAALVAWASGRLVARGRGGAAYLLVVLGWVAQEMARSSTPWGGFPWARLAFSQSEGPLVRLAAWGGAPLVTAAVALAGVALLIAARRLGDRRVLPALGALLLLAAFVLHAGNRQLPTDGERVTIAYVQGNVPNPGLDFNAERRAVLDNHVRGTEALAAQGLPEGTALVVWPENSSDIDPFRNPDAAAQIDRAVAAVDTPVLVGAVLAEPPGRNSNVSLLYRPGGAAPERYTKLHPVPFAEYIPYRSFFRIFSAEADKAGNFVAGDTIGAFEVPAVTGSFWALPTICFEVAYDGLMRDAVLNPRAGGDQVLVVQTNNATFGYTAESEQQFAISRLRAIEHGRSVVHVSTVGVSGFIAPDGTVTHKSGLFEPASATAPVVLRSDPTLSDRLGAWPERGASAAFVLLLALAAPRSGNAAGPRPVRVSDSAPSDPVPATKDPR